MCVGITERKTKPIDTSHTHNTLLSYSRLAINSKQAHITQLKRAIYTSCWVMFVSGCCCYILKCGLREKWEQLWTRKKRQPGWIYPVRYVERRSRDGWMDGWMEYESVRLARHILIYVCLLNVYIYIYQMGIYCVFLYLEFEWKCRTNLTS